jgi:hypothetical protein
LHLRQSADLDLAELQLQRVAHRHIYKILGVFRERD